MSWTYSTVLASDKDTVRFLIGDTDTDDQQFSDEEITAVLTLVSTAQRAAVRCCRALSARYARQADKWVGDLKILASQKSRRYADLATELSTTTVLSGSRTHQTPFAGGTSVARKATEEADADRPANYFRVGDMDNKE